MDAFVGGFLKEDMMRKKLLGLTVMACLMGVSVFAANDDVNSRYAAGYAATNAIASAIQEDSSPQWMQRTNVSVSFQQHWKPQYEIETVQPLTHVDETTKSVVFAQGRVANGTDLGTTVNVGVGYRHMNDAKTSMIGVNAFYDHGFKNHHSRMSGGVEYFHGQNEFRANVYRGLSDEREIDTTHHVFEKVVNGYDLGYAYTFKGAEWAKTYASVYRWDMKHHEDAKGFYIGAELQVTPNISVDLGYSKVQEQKGTMFGKVMYRLGKAPVALWGGKHTEGVDRSVESKLLSKVRRQNNIVVERYTKTAAAAPVNDATIQYTIRVI